MTDTIKSTSVKKGGTIKKFILPSKKVTLIPIIRNNYFMGKENHDGSFMYTGASKVWCIFRNEYGQYIDPLNATERLFLEKELGEDLNVNHEKNYWHTFEVKITKDTYNLKLLKRVFDLSNAKDYLAYKLLLTVPDVANSLKEKDDTPEYQWVLVEKDEVIQNSLSKGRMKSYCYNWLSENNDKKETLRNVLYVMNIVISEDSTKDELENSIINIIESSRLSLLHETLKDENLNVKILFAKALKAKVIIVKRLKYFNLKGELLAVTKDKMLEWLADPENSLEVVQMKEKIDKK